ncbi:sodium- and chloride-dependent glycine transporter 2 [Patella vulgata]|uniref:sodium- and chloride-dependent glycine transporter 2 n=1 Tax=Patella vulgata TaxID=6465 RepID=UPI0024A83A4D|nr:sodium- and chloride-dependent glycine transporter 2 [Patella vulgata]
MGKVIRCGCLVSSSNTNILFDGSSIWITMASYNDFKHNCHRDAVVVSMINCGTSIFAGFIIFSVLGFMAHTTNQDIEDVAVGGPGLVFIVYPEAIGRMPVAPVWAFLFFFMLIAVGLDSMFAMFEVVISAGVDQFPHYLRPRRTKFAIFCHFMGFILGIPLVTKGGIWVLTLMEWYSASFGLMGVCLAELMAVIWVYGLKNYCDDVEIMLGFKVHFYWKATWLIIAPVAIILMLIMAAVQSSPASYDNYQFEPWAQNLGWVMVALPFFLILIMMPIQSYRYGSVKKASQPTPEWGPLKPEDRTGKYAIKPEQPINQSTVSIINNHGIELKSTKLSHDNRAFASNI